MLQRKELHFFVLLLFLTFSAIAGYTTRNDVSGNDSATTGISRDETILFNMINDMRRLNKLSSIPLSSDLCTVAQTHIADLIKWKPQEKGCSLHSWSGNGKWTSCCNTKDVFGIQCMKSKPREITGYPGDGYELIYWGEDNATPAEAAALWNQVEASADMILSRAKWSGYQWKSIGVGIKSGYAVLWLGDAVSTNTSVSSSETQSIQQKSVTKREIAAKTQEAENKSVKPETPPTQKVTPKPEVVTKRQEPEKKSTKTESQVKQNTAVAEPKIKEKKGFGATPQFYLIVGSFKEFESANSEMKKVRLKGYPSAFILYQEPLYRIVISSSEDSEKASRLKNELKETFPGIWVFKK